MIGIILNILKIIGIILLVLLALIIVILCVVLFVPIRYQANGNFKGQYQVSAKVTWLLHAVTLKIGQSSSDSLHIILKIFGLTVYDNTKPAKESKGKKRSKKKSKNQKPTSVATSQIHAASIEAETEKTSSVSKSSSEDGVSNMFYETAEEKSSTQSKENAVHTDDSTDNETDHKDKLTILQKIRIFFHKFIHFLQNIKYTFRKFYDTIVNIKSNICYYCDLLSQDTTKAAFAAANKQLVRIVRNLKPRHWRIYLHIGMEDPAAMGDILGVWGMLYPLHEGHVELEPEFDNSVFEAEFSCKGRIHIFIYLWTAYIILFDKNIKQLKKCLLREEG